MLIGVGLLIRHRVAESPVFEELRRRRARRIAGAVSWGFATLYAARWSDRVGRKPVYLVEVTGTSLSVSAYIAVLALVTLAAVLAMRERPDAEREAFVDGVPDDASVPAAQTSSSS